MNIRQKKFMMANKNIIKFYDLPSLLYFLLL